MEFLNKFNYLTINDVSHYKLKLEDIQYRVNAIFTPDNWMTYLIFLSVREDLSDEEEMRD